MYPTTGYAQYKGVFYVLAVLFCFLSPVLNAQPCNPSENFEATQYNTVKATYEWNYDDVVLHYVIRLEINGEFYFSTELPGASTTVSVEFNPALKNYDEVSATLTKFCKYGGNASTTFDFVVITDGVVYLNGGPQNGDPNTVEPVHTIFDNLIPGTGVCGYCDPGFFRLTSGFYGPYGIFVDNSFPHPIEQLRFLKSELCDCLNKAVDEGLLDVNGGPGPNYNGEPFQCKLTPYVFEKEDCDRDKSEGEERNNISEKTAAMKAVPNPVTSSTTISYTLTTTSAVSIAVYDITGQLISRNNSINPVSPGNYQENLNTETWPGGMYFCTITTGAISETIKIIK